MGHQADPRSSRSYVADFGGVRLDLLRSSGIFLKELVYPSARSCRRHSHENAFFSLLLQGSYSESFGKTTLSHQQYSLAFHPSDTTHSDIIQAPGTHFFLVEIPSHFGIEFLPRVGDRVTPRLCSAGGTALVKELYSHFKAGTLSRFMLEETLCTLLWAAYDLSLTTELGRAKWLATIIDILRTHFSQPLTLGGLSRSVDLHPAYISRKFRQVYGLSVGAYVARLRISRAAVELSKPDRSLSEIAQLCGFADQAHFTRVFKQMKGLTPGVFRRQVLGCARSFTRGRAHT